MPYFYFTEQAQLVLLDQLSLREKGLMQISYDLEQNGYHSKQV